MKFLFSLFSLLFYYHAFSQADTSRGNLNKYIRSHAQVQKPLIDTGMLYSWPKLEGTPVLSSDGQYVFYNIYNQPVGKQTQVVQGTNTNWKKEIIDDKISFICFTADSKKLLWKRSDSLFLQILGTDEIRFLDAGKSFTLFPDGTTKNKAEWVVFSNDGELELINMQDDRKQYYSSVRDYFFQNDGRNLLLYQSNINSNTTSLSFVTLQTESSFEIWKGHSLQTIEGISLDNQHNQLAFLVKDDKKLSVWYYKKGMINSVEKIDDLLDGKINAHRMQIDRFDRTGQWIFLRQVHNQQRLTGKIDSTYPKLNIWDYRDVVLNPEQQVKPVVFYYPAIIAANVKTGELRKVASGVTNETPWSSQVEMVRFDFNESVVLLQQKYPVSYWKLGKGNEIYWLLSLKDGSKKQILQNEDKRTMGFSPNGRWLIWWDFKSHNYMSYDIQKGKKLNLTATMPTSFVKEMMNKIEEEPVGMGWLNDSTTYIYDNYDIWKISLSATVKYENVTNGYGKRNLVKLRIADEFTVSDKFKRNSPVLLTGLKMSNMNNGFFRCFIGSSKDPELLTMGAYNYYQMESQIGWHTNFNIGIKPLEGKRNDKMCWIIMRQSSDEYPNYYYTEDFKTLRPITDLHPEKKYKWLTSKLITWKMHDGKIGRGVLYKPENFEPIKKYPIIFNYYRQLSHRAYQFPIPELATSQIDIPWFVSRGYLVFTPDIYYNVTNAPSGRTPGESACNSVLSAAEYLSRLPYIDSRKMGIQGHSFGGLQTLYLVTHSHCFSAAAEMAGTSDWITSYLLLNSSDPLNEWGEKQSGVELFAMGATLWERPDLYLKSAVMNANKTTTPLLITHNKNDGQVNFRHGVEMYMSLRRLEKPCWLLQYDNEDHFFEDKSIAALDYTIRMTQFFDHFLKDQPAPKWMTQGIPAKLKQVENRYELDASGNCGKDCKVCKMWNAKQTAKNN